METFLSLYKQKATRIGKKNEKENFATQRQRSY